MKAVALGTLVVAVAVVWVVYPFTSTAEPSGPVSSPGVANVDQSAKEAGEPPSGIVIEDAKQVVVRVKGGWERELQWVQVRNHSDRVIDLSTADLRTEASYSLAPKGMQLVSGSFELVPRESAPIVTSPYVELDRGVAVEWPNVYLAFDESLNAQVHPWDIQRVELVTMMGEVLGTFGPLALTPSCCCEGSGATCDATLSGKNQGDCNENDCNPGPCGCWRPIGCPDVIPSSSCCPSGNCVLDL